MRPNDSDSIQTRRTFCAGLLSAGAVGCFGCAQKRPPSVAGSQGGPSAQKRPSAVVGSQDGPSAKKHKFQEDSKMSFEDAFNFAYAGMFIQTMLGMAEELGREKLVEILKNVASRQWAKQVAEGIKNLEKRDFETFVTPSRSPNYFWSHVLSKTIVEDSKNAFEMKITECLWAKIFREANAADIGYAGVCFPDYAAATVFNPKIKMIRTKTLMQGDGFCNHRYVYEET